MLVLGSVDDLKDTCVAQNYLDDKDLASKLAANLSLDQGFTVASQPVTYESRFQMFHH